MKTVSVFALILTTLGAGNAGAAVINWTMSPAVDSTEVDDTGVGEWAYMFSSAAGGDVSVNGVNFTRVNTTTPTMDAANAMTPGFSRFPRAGAVDSFGEASDDFYLGPNAELNQLLDGLTWGGNREFQLSGLNPGDTYNVQIFSSDDRGTQSGRVLDLDSSWAAANPRQVNDVDYTAGGPWVDPAGRLKIFTGTFTADATTQQILAALVEPTGGGDGTGQIDLNAIQLRIIPEPATGGLALALAGFVGLFRRRR